MKMLKFTTVLAGVMLAVNLSAQNNTNQTVTVRVRDYSGQPVAGATVEYYAYYLEETGKPDVGTTGDDGTAQVAVSENPSPAKVAVGGATGQVVVRKAGMAFDGVQVSSGTEQPIALALGQARSIAGTVVDESDRPVADARVSVCFITFGPDKVRDRTGSLYIVNQELQNHLSARTGADGRFRIDGIPTNSTVDLAVIKSGKALPLPQGKPSSSATMCRAGRQDIVLKIEPAGGVEGKVVVADPSFSLANVSLTLMSPQRQGGGLGPSTQAQADGSFRFVDVPAGSYLIMSKFGTNTVPDFMATQQLVFVQQGQIKRDVTIAAWKGGVLEVATVSSAGHKPLGRISFFVRSENSSSGTSETTDANGNRSLRLAPGKYLVLTVQPGLNATGEAQIEEGQTNRVELELSAPESVSGTVRDTNGSPAAGLEVRVFGRSTDSTTTDSNGHFKLSVVPDERGQVIPYIMVRDRVRNLAAVREIEDGTNVYDLQLAPGTVLVGRVQDEKGNPVVGASVNTVARSGGSGWWIDSGKAAKTDAQGRFEIGGLPIGRTYGLEISAKGYGNASSPEEKIDTNRFEFDVFTIKIADKKISGVVVDSEGNPVPGARVYVFRGRGQPDTSASADQQGRFVIEGVCEGSVGVGAALPNAHTIYSSGTIEAGDTNATVVLREGSERAPSQPRRASLVGKPLPDLTAVGLEINVIQTNKPVLLCLFDPEQRPSRRVIRMLADQNDAFKQKGIAVAGICANVITADALKEWKQSNPAPFPVGGVTEKNDKTQWIVTAEKFPWLILTDGQGRVKAEGFELDELDEKLKQQ